MPDLERVQQNTPLTLSQQWYESGVAVDPGTVTLGITRADGTVLLAAGQPTGGATTAARTFNLTTTHTGLLDTLTVTWTSTLKGVLVSYVEVVGGFLCPLAALQPLFPDKTAAELSDIRTTAEQRLEDECGQAFVPRYAQETLSGEGSTTLLLSYPNVRLIRTVTISGTPYTAGQLAAVAFNPSGILTNTYWPLGASNIVVGYEHGRPFPPPGTREAVLLAAQETFPATTGDGRIVRREADGQAVTYASPSSSGGFIDPLLRSFVRNNDLNIMVA